MCLNKELYFYSPISVTERGERNMGAETERTIMKRNYSE